MSMYSTLIQAPMDGNVYGFTMSDTHAHYTVPPNWRGGKVFFQAINANMFLIFGTAATVEADRTVISTVDTTVLTPVVKTSMMIPMGTAVELQLPAAATHFSVDADGAGEWRAWLSIYGS